MRRPGLKFRRLYLCLVLWLLAAGLGAAHAQTATPPPPPPDTPPDSIQQPPPDVDVRAVRLSDVQGDVKILNGENEAFSQAQLNMPIVQGMKIVTAEDGRAEIQFEDGSVARITPNSSITVSELGHNSDGTTSTVIVADAGLTYYELNGRAGQYEVHFARDIAVPNDSSIFRIDQDKNPAELAVMHGSVHVSNDQNLAVDINTNQTMVLDAQSPNQYQIQQSVAANSWDQWNSDRDEALARLGDNASEGRASTQNPDNPAWNDLDAYGDWYDVPGYGMGWTPNGVGQDWDPYGAGAWGYYNNFGYTWISAYPWGWWPYHCGGWNWFGGFGWMWFPGSCGWGGVGFVWYPYGRIWHYPPGYHCPRRPVPVHNPIHGLVPRERLIAVNRGPQFTHQDLSIGAHKTAPHVFAYNGQNIHPVPSLFQSHQSGPMGGPLGESFTTRVIRSGPGVTLPRPNNGVVYRAPGTPAYQPNRGYVPPSRPAPVYRAPAPVYHPSAPPPAYHPAPAPPPAFHPSAPAPAPGAPAGHPR